MKQAHIDKHTIAWFKIAECVSRGEKERALGVYRLLSYSFNDMAVALQLEADIYFSFFEQEQAIVLYHQAMDLYQKSERYLEAAAVCEHLITMRPHDLLLRREVIKLYHPLGLEAKMRMHIQKIVDTIFLTGNELSLQEFLAVLRTYSDELYEYGVACLK